MDHIAPAGDGSIEDIGDEQICAAARIPRSHIPRAVEERAIKGFPNIPTGIQHQQASGLCGSRSTVGSRQAAHDDPSAAQHRQGRGQSDTTGARTGQSASVDLSEQAAAAVWSDLQDGGSGALQIRTVVEIADQDISGDQ